MSQSLANILVHIVFSTKFRFPFLQEGFAMEVHRDLASICRSRGCPSHRIGGTEDHVHMVCSLSRTLTVSKLVEEAKKLSSKWVKTRGGIYQAFGWQSGYGAFSVAQSQLATVLNYVDNQKAHHRQKSFQEEYRELLERQGVPYDERYIWE